MYKTILMAAKKDKTGIGVILLAAGSSSRLGRPKQLLLHGGRTLLQHSLQVACVSAADPVVVVLGAQAEVVRRGIGGADVHVVINGEWQEGIASSIRCGIHAFTGFASDAKGVILMVCDQPFVSALLLNDLIAAYQKTGKPIVACTYENTFGPPVFFHQSLFADLLQLKGDVGARGVVRRYSHAVEIIPFPEGTCDIDTQADYERIKSNVAQ